MAKNSEFHSFCFSYSFLIRLSQRFLPVLPLPRLGRAGSRKNRRVPRVPLCSTRGYKPRLHWSRRVLHQKTSDSMLRPVEKSRRYPVFWARPECAQKFIHDARDQWFKRGRSTICESVRADKKSRPHLSATRDRTSFDKTEICQQVNTLKNVLHRKFELFGIYGLYSNDWRFTFASDFHTLVSHLFPSSLRSFGSMLFPTIIHRDFNVVRHLALWMIVVGSFFALNLIPANAEMTLSVDFDRAERSIDELSSPVQQMSLGYLSLGEPFGKILTDSSDRDLGTSVRRPSDTSLPESLEVPIDEFQPLESPFVGLGLLGCLNGVATDSGSSSSGVGSSSGDAIVGWILQSPPPTLVGVSLSIGRAARRSFQAHPLNCYTRLNAQRCIREFWVEHHVIRTVVRANERTVVQTHASNCRTQRYSHGKIVTPTISIAHFFLEIHLTRIHMSFTEPQE